MSEHDKLLRIYLEDHFAGATAGAARARRLADAEVDSADGPSLATFADEVAAEREQLMTIMGALDIPTNRIKTELAAIGEKIGALKTNGHLVSRSPLSTIVELEAMQMAVRGKRALWKTLQATPGAATVPAVDLVALERRSDEQLATLDAIHDRRVPTTFGAGAR